MRLKQLFVLLLLGILLTACGLRQTNNTIQPAIYTAVAQTLTANPTKTPPGGISATPIPANETVTLTFTPGPTATRWIPTATAKDCNQSTFIGDLNIPDNTVFSPGETFTKKWAIKNIGSCTWNASYSIKFISGTQMGGMTTKINKEIAPQTSLEAAVDLTAPTASGTYTGYWQMADDSGSLFGTSFYVKIIVVATSTGTITYTPSITPTWTSTPIYIIVTATPGPTKTSLPTATNVPTVVPTKTPVPTNTSLPTEIPPSETPVPAEPTPTAG